MDLSPGRRSAPSMLRAGRTTTVESSSDFDISLNITEKKRIDCEGENRRPITKSGRDSNSHHRLRFGGSFFENLCGHFFDAHTEFEHRSLRPSSPSADFPVCAQELGLGMRSQVQQHGMLRLVKLLRKVGYRSEEH